MPSAKATNGHDAVETMEIYQIKCFSMNLGLAGRYQFRQQPSVACDDSN